jgi:hypothetical protein
MKAKRIGRAIMLLLASASIAVMSASARASDIRVTMTVDNSYALFYGTVDAATNFVGSDFNWPNAETYNFTLDSTKYLYVVTASDLSVAQGFLGQFENLSTGFKFYSNDPQWQVAATGLGPNAPYTGSAANLQLLTQQIASASSGSDASGGWASLTAGPSNGGGPWGSIGGIDSAAKWVWYSSNGDPDPTTPGFDHHEWLIFRIAVAATPDVPIPTVPEPGTEALFLSGLMGLLLLRRIRKA